ncbi:hypothetical protein GCM10020331_021850 [Ectobacillus funiculus]
MIGFTPQLVTGVWVGYDKERDITSAAEQRYAKNIWADVMEKGLEKGEKKEKNLNSLLVLLPSTLTRKKWKKIATKGCPLKVKKCISQREQSQQNTAWIIWTERMNLIKFS